MVYVLIGPQIIEHDKMGSGFDSTWELRLYNGEEPTQIFNDINNPNLITRLNKWTSVEK